MPKPTKRATAAFKWVNTRLSAGSTIVLRNHLGNTPLLDPNDVGFPSEARDWCGICCNRLITTAINAKSFCSSCSWF